MNYIKLLLITITFLSLSTVYAQKPVYVDTKFLQDESTQYEAEGNFDLQLQKVAANRNLNIQVLSRVGLLQPADKTLKPDLRYAFAADLQINDLIEYKNHFVYLTDHSIYSNAWAGKIFINHDIAEARILSGGADFDFMCAGKNTLNYFIDKKSSWVRNLAPGEDPLSIEYDEINKTFWILFDSKIATYTPASKKYKVVYTREGLTSLRPGSDGTIYVGTADGITILASSGNKIKELKELPWTEITTIEEIGSKLWVGTTRGVFSLDENDQINYYASRRWLVDDYVIDVSEGPNDAVLVLTKNGLSKITFTPMTLNDKANHFEDQVRKRHIRHGFNTAEFVMRKPGDLSSGSLTDSDNDGLWTTMYLVSQVFRYEVTKSPIAYQNVIESFEALERLDHINPIQGFLSRSFERRSYALHDQEAWREAEDPEWDWKGTTSSDEYIGHYLAFSLIAELIPDETIKQRAIKLIVDMTDHIIENDLYLVDIDGKPTRWGRWNPEYVNGFPVGVGDRKLNSSNITGFLQAAYHFTKDEKYKKEAFRLFNEFGYLDNLMLPMDKIGNHEADELSAMLSSTWNHSDDEMYFISYYYLYHYAFNAELKEKYREAIRDHWNIERPEKDALWNFVYAMMGSNEFDLDESIWYLREFPMDLIQYSVHNSHRKDIKLLPENFRGQTTEVVLPPDEKPIFKHNTNTFTIDRNSGGRAESSGDIYLLPYWWGRYLGVISAPKD